MKIIEYEDKYLEDVKDLLVELEEYILTIDKDHLDQLHPEYRDKMAILDLEEVKNNNGKCYIAVEDNKAVAAIMGIKEFGLEKALTTIANNHFDKDTEEANAITVATMMALVGVALPDLLNDPAFAMMLSNRLISMDKEKIDSYCDAILNGIEGGNQ